MHLCSLYVPNKSQQIVNIHQLGAAFAMSHFQGTEDVVMTTFDLSVCYIIPYALSSSWPQLHTYTWKHHIKYIKSTGNTFILAIITTTSVHFGTCGWCYSIWYFYTHNFIIRRYFRLPQQTFWNGSCILCASVYKESSEQPNWWQLICYKYFVNCILEGIVVE